VSFIYIIVIRFKCSFILVDFRFSAFTIVIIPRYVSFILNTIFPGIHFATKDYFDISNSTLLNVFILHLCYKHHFQNNQQ